MNTQSSLSSAADREARRLRFRQEIAKQQDGTVTAGPAAEQQKSSLQPMSRSFAENSLSTAAVSQILLARFIESIEQGDAGKVSVDAISHGDTDGQSDICHFQYHVETVTREHYSGSFPFHRHQPYQLLSKAITAGGLYQQVALYQSEQGESKERLSLTLDLNTASAFYAALADKLDAVIQDVISVKAEKPVIEISETAAEAPAPETTGSDQSESEQPEQPVDKPSEKPAQAKRDPEPVQAAPPSAPQPVLRQRSEQTEKPSPQTQRQKNEPRMAPTAPANHTGAVEVNGDAGLLGSMPNALKVSAIALLALAALVVVAMIVMVKSGQPETGVQNTTLETPAIEAHDPAGNPNKEEGLWVPN